MFNITYILHTSQAYIKSSASKLHVKFPGATDFSRGIAVKEQPRTQKSVQEAKQERYTNALRTKNICEVSQQTYE